MALDDENADSSKRRWGTVMLLTLFTFFALSMVVLIALSMIVPPAMNELVEIYTALEPEEIPEVVLSDIEIEAIETRLEEFEDALQGDDPVEPLELNEREINGLLNRDDKSSNTHLTIEHDALHAQMSLPIDTDLEIGPWRASMRGRYINGIAELRLIIKDDILVADLISFTVKGERVPTWLRRVLQNEIDNLDWLQSQDIRDVVGKLDRIEFEEGRLVFHPK